MAKTYFDFGAATNGTGTPNNPKNTLTGFTFNAGDEFYFRRGTSFTGAFNLTAGLPGRRTKYGAWYNRDGSDDLTKAKPIFNLTAGVSTLSSTNKDNVDISSLDIRAVLTVAADTSAVYLGNNSSITNCNVDSNIGGIAAWGKSNVTIAYNTVNAVKDVGTANVNSGITVSSSVAADSIVILNNRVYHNNGGSTASHAIRAEATGSYDMTNVVIEGNEVSPPSGVTFTTNLGAIGIRVQRCPAAKIRFNKVYGMLKGVFVIGAVGAPISVTVASNDLSSNMNYGLELNADTNGCIVEYNTCSYNGVNNTAVNCYGRGIEMSSDAGQARCANHIIRFNVCSYNKNYGGTADDGSEGVGIGLDDATMGCHVYGNIVSFNEGNGIQYNGVGNPGTWPDTGNNNVVANYFESNGTNSFTSRRTGGTAETLYIAHIYMSNVFGTLTNVANNVMVGGKLGISIASNCSNVEVSNNVFHGVANGIQFGGTPGGSYNNFFWKAGLTSMNKYCTMATTSGSVAFTALAYTGVNDFTTDPLLNSNYKPKLGSPCIGAGRALGVFKDKTNRPFKAPPSIGMYEWYPSSILPVQI